MNVSDDARRFHGNRETVEFNRRGQRPRIRKFQFTSDPEEVEHQFDPFRVDESIGFGHRGLHPRLLNSSLAGTRSSIHHSPFTIYQLERVFQYPFGLLEKRFEF